MVLVTWQDEWNIDVRLIADKQQRPPLNTLPVAGSISSRPEPSRKRIAMLIAFASAQLPSCINSPSGRSQRISFCCGLSPGLPRKKSLR